MSTSLEIISSIGSNIEDIKEQLTSENYKNIMESLMKLKEKKEDETLYKLHFLEGKLTTNYEYCESSINNGISYIKRVEMVYLDKSEIPSKEDLLKTINMSSSGHMMSSYSLEIRRDIPYRTLTSVCSCEQRVIIQDTDDEKPDITISYPKILILDIE